jgi:quinol monooxygenase YgiN
LEKIYGFVSLSIAEGREADFIAGARACHEAALPDLAGTDLYEWYLSDDGRQAWVIEVYDDPPAVAHHGRMMDGRPARLREFASFDIIFAGQVPSEMLEAMRTRLGDAADFGRLAHGLLTDRVAHRPVTDRPQQLCALAWFTPKPGQIRRLRHLADKACAQARTDGPGTRAYEWFFNDQGAALVLDVYADADAMLTHMKNCGPIMREILGIADSRTILFGDLPADISAKLSPDLGVTQVPRRLHGVF